MVSSKFLKVGLYNPGSLGTHHEDVIVAVTQRSVDVLAINETWLRPNEEDKAPCIPGYTLRSAPRSALVHAGRGGGVAFYLRKGIYARSCDHPVCLKVEQMWLKINVNGLKIIVGTAYRPQWVSVDIFLEAVVDSINSLCYYDGLILLGDFNIDLLAPTSVNSRKLLDTIKLFNLKQIVDTPTHFTEYSETMIDLICTDCRVRSVSTAVIGSKLSNHALITCEFNFKKPKPIPKRLSYRCLKDIGIDSFHSDIGAIPWHGVLNLGNVNEMAISMTDLITKMFDLHSPTKSIIIKQQSLPWVTENVKLMMRLRNEAHMRFLRTKDESHKRYYKDFKNLVNTTLNLEKVAYFRQHINRHVKDPTTLWRNIKLHILPPKLETDLPSHLCSAEDINTYFLDLPESNNDSSLLTYFMVNRASNFTFTLKTVDSSLIMRIVNNLKSNALGVDGISLDMLLLTLPTTLDTLNSIVNTSIESSTFPDIWKTAIVRPLPKNTNPLTFKDLRPISILPCMSKVLERVVCQQLTEYLESNSILPQYQSGFRKNHSTSTALIDVTGNILEAQDRGMGTILVLLDFSRAFDTISIPLLLGKLVYYGFDEHAVKWFGSYLSNRSQYVKISRGDGSVTTSSPAQVRSGIPQGSILGPLLFILYVADVINCIRNCRYHLYADDLQLYLSCKPSDISAAVESINEDLERICQWSKLNSLSLNPNKSKYVILGSRQQVSSMVSMEPRIIVHGEAIAGVREARNLGLILDSELRFESYITEVARNCFYRLKILYKMRDYLSTDLRLKLVESLILSKFNYADTVYGPRLLAKTKTLIQRVQNACLRFCYKIPPRSHISPYLAREKLLNMSSRRYLHFATLLFGVVKRRKPLYLYDRLTWSLRTRLNRLCLQPHRTAAFQGTFKYAAAKIWNDIPPPIRDTGSSTGFRNKLKELMLMRQVNGYGSNPL